MKNNQLKGKAFHTAEYPVLLVIAVLILLMSVFIPDFRTSRNITNLFIQMSIYGIAMVGLVFALIGGGIDLSLASNAMISSIMCATVMTKFPQAGTVGGIIIGMLFGAGIGALNGLIATKFGVNPFIGTISMQLFLNGFGVVFTNGATLSGLPSSFTAIGKMKISVFPVVVIIMFVFYAVGHYVTRKTAFGRKLYAAGTNPEAARMVGIPVVKIRMLSFVICGFCASVAGMVSMAKLTAVSANPSSDLFLDTLCASIIGGASLSGGKGNIVGAAFGVLLLSLISNGVNLLGINRNMTLVIKGIIILIAIVLDISKGKQKARRVSKKKENAGSAA